MIKMIKNQTISTLVSVAVLAITSNSVWAAGTDADTSINNRATISYSVSGATQASINSSSSASGNSDPDACDDALTNDGSVPAASECATTFKVDRKIDLTVTGTTAQESVAPNQASNTTGTGANTILSYTVTNTGNSDEYFDLRPIQLASFTDEFDADSCDVTSPVITLPTVSYLILEDQQLDVEIQCNIPAASTGVEQGDTAIVALLATAVTDSDVTTPYTDSGSTESAAVVDTVLADDNAGAGTADEGFTFTGVGSTTAGERNGSDSDVSTYVISTAALAVKKEAFVVWDPINEDTNPKRIPGSIIRYDITVTNTGAEDATGVAINDVLDSNVTYLATAAEANALGAGAATASGFAACASSVGSGVAFTCSFDTPSTTVTSAAFTLPDTSGTGTMSFFVTIKN